MTNPWWLSLLAAGIGAGSAMIGSWMTHRFTAKRDRQQFERLTERQDAEWQRQHDSKLHDVRAALYVDVMEFLEDLTVALEFDPQHPIPSQPGPLSDVQHPTRLAARIKLYGDDGFRTSWADFNDVYQQLAEVEFANAVSSLLIHQWIDPVIEAINDLQDLLRERVLSVSPVPAIRS